MICVMAAGGQLGGGVVRHLLANGVDFHGMSQLSKLYWRFFL